MEDKFDTDLHEFSEYIDESEPVSPQNLSPKKSQSHQPPCTPSISRLFSILIFCIGTGLFLSIISYNGIFHFWRYPLSNLGTLKTVNGNINIWARSFFDLTMIVAGFYMFRISRLFFADPNLNFLGIKTIMTSMSSLGFFILLTPYDLSNIIHEIGAALVFGTLWGLTILFSIELFKSAFKKKPYYRK